MTTFKFTEAERDRRWRQTRETMKKRGLEALVVWGSFGWNANYTANLRYLSNTKVEGYLVFPFEGEPTLVTYTGKPQQQWVTDFRGGHPTYAKTVADRLKELRLNKASIGLVGLSGYFGEMGFPHAAYTSLVDHLPKAQFKDATDIVEVARMVKSDEEVRCFELGCEVAIKVMQAIVDTAGPGVKDYEVKAKIMNTLFVNGCDPESMILYCSGKEIYHAGQGSMLLAAGTKSLAKGEVILTEIDSRFLGYKAQHNQPFSIGEPTKEWRQIFDTALASFNAGLKILKPGITTGQLDEAFQRPIKKAGYTYMHPAFHGLGLALEEPIGDFPDQPAYQPDPNLVIKANMVFEFEPHPVTLDKKKGISFGCPVLVTQTGCKILNKGWKPEFKVARAA